MGLQPVPFGMHTTAKCGHELNVMFGRASVYSLGYHWVPRDLRGFLASLGIIIVMRLYFFRYLLNSCRILNRNWRNINQNRWHNCDQLHKSLIFLESIYDDEINSDSLTLKLVLRDRIQQRIKKYRPSFNAGIFFASFVFTVFIVLLSLCPGFVFPVKTFLPLECGY